MNENKKLREVAGLLLDVSYACTLCNTTELEKLTPKVKKILEEIFPGNSTPSSLAREIIHLKKAADKNNNYFAGMLRESVATMKTAEAILDNSLKKDNPEYRALFEIKGQLKTITKED